MKQESLPKECQGETIALSDFLQNYSSYFSVTEFEANKWGRIVQFYILIHTEQRINAWTYLNVIKSKYAILGKLFVNNAFESNTDVGQAALFINTSITFNKSIATDTYMRLSGTYICAE